MIMSRISFTAWSRRPMMLPESSPSGTNVSTWISMSLFSINSSTTLSIWEPKKGVFTEKRSSMCFWTRSQFTFIWTL